MNWLEMAKADIGKQKIEKTMRCSKNWGRNLKPGMTRRGEVREYSDAVQSLRLDVLRVFHGRTGS